MDSYRAEAYGLLSITTCLHLLGKYHNHQVPPTEIWCDNLAVVNTENRIVRTRPELLYEILQPSWDLIQAKGATVKLHLCVSLHHVKERQGTLTDVRDPLSISTKCPSRLVGNHLPQASNYATGRGPFCQVVLAICS
jgi:hypothetical protein